MAESDKATTDGPADDGVKVFTREEVKAHKTEKDAWLIIDGHVYDVTGYLEEHPGGPEIMMDSAGTDATEEFNDTGHSEDARTTLKKFLVGKAEGGAASAPGAVSKSGGEGPSTLLILATLIALIAGAYMMYEPTV